MSTHTLSDENEAQRAGQRTKPSRTATILIVEDDRSINNLLALRLGNAGYRTIQAFDGETGLELIKQHRPELVTLDLMLPNMDGWQFIREVRQVSLVPILVLSARVSERDELRGLALGADEYVRKPFNFASLLARVDALLRRAPHADREDSSSLYKDAAITIDYWQREVRVRGTVVQLSPTEYTLLLMLVRHYGQVLTVEKLLADVWGPEYKDVAIVKAYITTLRRKIERDPQNPELIHTTWGVGYRYELI